ncbi:hypothetical protein C8N46_106150 [Kordia periserrulae]|uniref:SMI1/KNR4 family protein SUKH-1 n=1 Tax=Kordia periserrulae TaxID=701523 RepID=A0A2T6BWP9_9FLAO|nr:hypothetical protein [Kordia periserrulae]PTX60505.1 hypothetical protein C8N46_106150 [Kordia periserrulae]
MEILYMQKLKDNIVLNKVRIEGISTEAILDLETKYNNSNPFPKAFREYLYLAGKISGTGIVWNDWEMLQEDLQEFFETFNYSIGRPIFPFNKRDGGSIFSFFYLDEDKDDPDCYHLMSGDYVGEKSPVIRSSNNYTFSGLINEAIRRIKNNIPF